MTTKTVTEWRTPEQIADDTLRTDDNWTQTSDPLIVRDMLIRAIEADRAQRETYRIEDLDGTEDEADWLAEGHVLDYEEADWLRTREIVA